MSRGILAAGSARVSEMVATLPSHLQRPFNQAKALYRFPAPAPRVGTEALLEKVCWEGALALEGEEVLVWPWDTPTWWPIRGRGGFLGGRWGGLGVLWRASFRGLGASWG